MFRKLVLTVATLITAVGATAYAAQAGTAGAAAPTGLAGKSFLFQPGPILIPGAPAPVTGVKFVVEYHSADRMTFTQVAGPTNFGVTCENERVHATTITDGIYFVRWVEASGLAVSHVDDLARNRATVSTVIPMTLTGAPTPLLLAMSGPFTPYRGAPEPSCPNNGSGV